MVIAIILILFAVALFLIFHDDHDDSYTRSDKRPGREGGQKSVYRKSVENRRHPATTTSSTPRPAPVMNPRSSAPQPKARTSNFIYEEEEKVLDFHFLDRIDYDESLPERTMSSFIAGVQSHCTEKDLGGVVGYVAMDRKTGAMEVHAGDDRLLGFLPMKDRAAFLAFNPTLVVCPFAGHIALSVTGAFYADVRIVLPSTRDFVEESLTGFLG